jgi:hypothetical protein
MIPFETFLGIEGWGMKESKRGVNSSMIYLIHFKNFYKYLNVPSPSTTIILKRATAEKIKYFPIKRFSLCDSLIEKLYQMLTIEKIPIMLHI